MEKKAATEKQIKYATDIAELTKLDPPDFSDMKATSDFIAKNRKTYYVIKNTIVNILENSDFFK